MRTPTGSAATKVRVMSGLAAALLIIMGLVGVVSCQTAPARPIVPTASPTSIPPASPTSPPQPTAIPTPLATVQPTPYPTAVPEIGQAEAQSAVRAWFDAVVAQDYGTASDLTVGSAADRTRELSEGFQKATGGNTIQLALQRLDLSPGPPQADGSQAVKADFEVQVNAMVGPISVGVQRLTGNATFFVGRLGDRTRITDIRDVTGLPVAQ